MVIIIVGAGSHPRHMEIQTHDKRHTVNKHGVKISACGADGWMADWGIRQWAPYLLDLLLSGDSVTTEMVMHYMMGRSNLYHRFDPVLPRPINIDDTAALNELTEIGEKADLTKTLKFIDNNFMHLDLSHADENMVTNTLDNSSAYHDAWVDNVSYIYRGE